MEILDYATISSRNVRRLLKYNKISVRKIAGIINVAPTSLNDSLKSKKGIPIDSLIRISNYFNVTVNDLCNPDFSCDDEGKHINVIELKNKYMSLDNRGKQIVSAVLNIEYTQSNI